VLLVGNNGDRSLKAVDPSTLEVTTVARLGPGIIDGIASDADGNYIVSHWEGRVYRISPAGEKVTLLDLTGPQRNCADLAYVPDTDLMVIPGFADNRVFAYRVTE
jgi:sugar lactone lactonase YvrE